MTFSFIKFEYIQNDSGPNYRKSSLRNLIFKKYLVWKVIFKIFLFILYVVG